MPDLVLSGINHGGNASIRVLYSGTMSAAIEAAIEGVPAIGFSLCDWGSNPHFDHANEYITKITEQVLNKGIPENVALNVNFPAYRPERPIKGIKVCRQANALFKEQFVERQDPNGEPYFWMSGYLDNFDKGQDNDEWAIANDYISVVPCQFDMTAHHAVNTINREWDL